MTDSKFLHRLHSDVQQRFEGTPEDFNIFVTDLQKEDKRKNIFDGLSKEFDMGGEDLFNQKINEATVIISSSIEPIITQKPTSEFEQPQEYPISKPEEDPLFRKRKGTGLLSRLPFAPTIVKGVEYEAKGTTKEVDRSLGESTSQILSGIAIGQARMVRTIDALLKSGFAPKDPITKEPIEVTSPFLDKYPKVKVVMNYPILENLAKELDKSAEFYDAKGISGTDPVSKVMKILYGGAGQAAWDLPFISSVGLVKFMAATSAGEAAIHNKNVAGGAAIGATEGALLHQTFKALGYLPRSARVLPAGAIGAVFSVQEEMGKPLRDWDWEKIAGDVIMFEGFAQMGGTKGATLKSLRRNLKADIQGKTLEELNLSEMRVKVQKTLKKEIKFVAKQIQKSVEERGIIENKPLEEMTADELLDVTSRRSLYMLELQKDALETATKMDKIEKKVKKGGEDKVGEEWLKASREMDVISDELGIANELIVDTNLERAKRDLQRQVNLIDKKAAPIEPTPFEELRRVRGEIEKIEGEALIEPSKIKIKPEILKLPDFTTDKITADEFPRARSVKNIKVFRTKRDVDKPGIAGTFYWFSTSGDLKDMPKEIQLNEKSISFKKALVLPQKLMEEGGATIGSNGIEPLFFEMFEMKENFKFDKYLKGFPEGVHDLWLMDNAVANRTIELGYDGIVLGIEGAIDLKGYQQAEKYFLPPKKVGVKPQQLLLQQQGRLSQLKTYEEEILKGKQTITKGKKSRTKGIHNQIGTMASKIMGTEKGKTKENQTKRHDLYEQITGKREVSEMTLDEKELLFNTLGKKELPKQKIQSSVDKLIADKVQSPVDVVTKKGDNLETRIWTKKEWKNILNEWGVKDLDELSFERLASLEDFVNEQIKNSTDASLASSEVITKMKAKYRLPIGDVVNRVRTKFSRRAKRIATIDQLHLTTMANSFGKEGTLVNKILSGDILRGETHKNAVVLNASIAIRQNLIALGVTPGKLRDWGGEIPVITPMKIPKVETLRPGSKETGTKNSLAVSTGDLMTLYGVAQDPAGRERITKYGHEFTTGGDIYKFTEGHLQFIEKNLDPRARAIVDNFMSVRRDQIRPQIINTLKEMNVPWAKEMIEILEKGDSNFPIFRARELLENSPESLMETWTNRQYIKGGKERSLHKRKGGNLPTVGQNFFTLAPADINRSASFIGNHIPVSRAFALMKNPQFRETVKDRYNDADYLMSSIESALVDQRGLSYARNENAAEMFRSALSKTHTAVLGLKPHIIAIQSSSYVTAGIYFPKNKAGAPKFLYTPRKPVVMGVNSDAVLDKFQKYSPTLYLRAKSGGINIVSPGLNDLSLTDYYFGAGDKSLRGIKWMDTNVIMNIWEGVELWGKSEGLKGEGLMKWTANKVEDIVAKSQPNWSIPSISGLARQARKNPLLRPAVMFTSQRSQNLNILVRESQDYWNGERTFEDSKNYLSNLGTMAISQGMVLGIRNASKILLAGGSIGAAKIAFHTGLWDYASLLLGNVVIVGDTVNLLVAGSRKVLGDDQVFVSDDNIMEAMIGHGLEAKDNLLKAINNTIGEDAGAVFETGKMKGKSKAVYFEFKAAEKAALFAGMLLGKPVGGGLQLSEPVIKKMFPELRVFDKSDKWHYDMYELAQETQDADVERFVVKEFTKIYGAKAKLKLHKNYKGRVKKEMRKK